MEHDNCTSSSQLTGIFSGCIAGSVVMVLCFVLGVPGNLSVLGILARRSSENSFTLRMMVSLALSDLLTLLPLPMWIWAFLHDWVFGSVTCKIVSYVEYWCHYCSTLCVTLLSVQRYMQVLHPQKWAKLGTRGENGLLCGIWILSGVLSLYAPVLYEIACIQCGSLGCQKMFRNDAEKIGTAFLEILLFSICFFVLIFFYYRLHRGVNESPFFSSNRMTQLLTRIVVAFFIFYVMLPIAHVLVIIALLLDYERLLAIAELIVTIARTVTLFNCWVNPFLYAFSLRGLHCGRTALENT